MKTKRIFAALIVGICVFLGLFTLNSNRRLLNNVSSASAEDGDQDFLSPLRPSGSNWAPASVSVMKGVKSSIIAQLNAFKKDDYQEAIFYQSHGLRRNFFTAERFRQTIRQEYPEFADYQSIIFGPIMSAANSKFAEVPVKLTGANGNIVMAIYLMVLEQQTFRVAQVEGGGGGPRGMSVPPDPSFT